jgi:hypothetical protein
MDKLPYLNEDNFQTDKLKNLLPESKHHLLTDTDEFTKSIYICIKESERNMEKPTAPNRTSQFSTKKSTIFSKLEIIYNSVVSLAYNAPSWRTLYFEVANYDPLALPTASAQLVLLGVNRQELVVVTKKQDRPLVAIKLCDLVYKVTVMSIFI